MEIPFGDQSLTPDSAVSGTAVKGKAVFSVTVSGYFLYTPLQACIQFDITTKAELNVLKDAEVCCTTCAEEGFSSAKTDSAGRAVLYLNNGRHMILVKREGYPETKGFVTVKGADRLYFVTMGENSGKFISLCREAAEEIAGEREYTGTPDEYNRVTTPDGVWYQLYYDDHAEVNTYEYNFSNDGPSEIEIYSKINGLPVTKIGDKSFLYCKGNTAQSWWCRCAVRFFVRLYRNDAVGLSPSKEFLCKMTEKMQADAPPSRQAGFVRCCLKH